MIVFVGCAAVLLLAGIATVLWPLWRGTRAEGSRREANIAVFEQHTAAVERAVVAGDITQAQAQARRDELGARLLEDVDAAQTPAVTGARSRPWLSSAAVVIGFVVLAVGLYSMVGDLRGLHLNERPDIDALVAKMEARVAAVPGDVRTRALLAQVYMAQHDYAAAAQALAAINARLDKPDVTFLLTEARARVLGNGGTVNKRAQALYDKVLQLAPNNAEALWFAGLAALAEGRDEAVIAYWKRLLQQDISTDFRDQVERRLAELLGHTPSLSMSPDS